MTDYFSRLALRSAPLRRTAVHVASAPASVDPLEAWIAVDVPSSAGVQAAPLARTPAPTPRMADQAVPAAHREAGSRPPAGRMDALDFAAAAERLTATAQQTGAAQAAVDEFVTEAAPASAGRNRAPPFDGLAAVGVAADASPLPATRVAAPEPPAESIDRLSRRPAMAEPLPQLPVAPDLTVRRGGRSSRSVPAAGPASSVTAVAVQRGSRETTRVGVPVAPPTATERRVDVRIGNVTVEFRAPPPPPPATPSVPAAPAPSHADETPRFSPSRHHLRWG